MNRKRGKIISVIAIILVFLMIFGTVILPLITANASTMSELQQKYDQLEAQQKKVESQIKAGKSKQADAAQEVNEISENMDLISQQISVVNEQISSLDTKISSLNAKIEDLNSQIDEKEQLIEKTQVSIKKNYELFQERLIALYKTGDYSYLDVLLSSSDITDYLYKTQLLKSVSKHDTKLLSTLQEQLKTVQDAKTALESDKTEVEATKADVEASKADQAAKRANLREKKGEINDQYAQQKKLLKDIKSDTAALKDLDEKIQKQMEQADAEIKKLARQSSGSYTGGGFLWPIQNFHTYISSPFGYRIHPITGKYSFHSGIDIAGSGIAHHPIVAANSGTVKFAGNTGSGFGNYVVIDHGGGIMTLYGHAYKLAVKTGQKVKRGQVIAYVGMTGAATGYHLHFSVLKNGNYVNPLNYTYAGRK